MSHPGSLLRRAFAVLAVVTAPLAAHAGTTPSHTLAPNGFDSVQHTVATGLYNAASVAVDGSGNVYVNETGNYRIQKYSNTNGTPVVVTALTYGTSVTVGAIAADDAGELFLFTNGGVRMETPAGGGAYTETTVDTITGNRALAVSRDGTALYAGGTRQGSFTGQTIFKFTRNGAGYTLANGTVASNLVGLGPITVDPSGNVYYTNSSSQLKEAVYSNGAYSQQTIDSGIPFVYGLATDATGTLYAGYGDGSTQNFVAVYRQYNGTPAAYLVGGGLAVTTTPIAVSGGVHPQIFAATGSDGQLLQFSTEGSLGTLPVGTSAVTYRANFSFPGTTTLNAAHPFAVTGTTVGSTVASDFQPLNGGAICSGVQNPFATCAIDVTFTPTRPGVRSGAVVLYSDSGSVLFQAPLGAIATGPQAGFDYTKTDLSNLGDNTVSFGGLASDSSGELYGILKSSGQLLRANANTSGGPTVVATGVTIPGGVAVDGSGTVFYVNNQALQMAMPAYGQATYALTAVSADSSGPLPTGVSGVAADAYGNLYVASTSSNLVYKGAPVTPGVYAWTTISPMSISGASAVAVGPKGDVFVASGSKIISLAPVGNNRYLQSTAVDLSSGGSFITSSINSLAVDNNNDLFYGLGSGAEGVRESAYSGGQWGTSTIIGYDTPVTGVAITNSGKLYVAADQHDIYQYDPTTPPAQSFESAPKGHTSADSPKRVFLHNTGNTALVLTVPTASSLTPQNPGSNLPDYTVAAGDINPCGLTTAASSQAYQLPAGGVCDVNVSFTPSVTGPVQGSLIYTDNSLNGPSSTYQSMSLVGNGLVAPSKLQFSPTAAPPPTLTAGGKLGHITVQEADESGNVVTTGADTIQLKVTNSNGQVIYQYSVAATNGEASFDLSFEPQVTRAGTTVVSATATAVSPATADVTVTPAAVDSVSATGGTPQTTGVGTGFGAALQATAYDLYSNPIPGAAVTFTAPASGASASFSPSGPVTTNSSGVAAVGASANGTAGSYTVTATSNGKTASFSLTNAAAITVSPASLSTTPTVGASFSQTFSASGGTAPYTYSVSAGALPDGLTLSSAGLLSGTPTTAGSFSFTVRATDSTANSGTASFTGSVAKGTATVTVNSSVVTYDANGHFATATTAPAGLSVNLTYTLNGAPVTTPANAGTYAVTATVNDPNYNGSGNGTLTINKATATVTISAPTATYDGNGHFATATTTPSGLNVNLTYTSVSGGNVPVTTPTNAGTYSVSATISDANYQGSNTGQLVINAAQATVTLGSTTAMYDGTPHAVTVTTSPAGLAVNVTYEGSNTAPTAAGQYHVVAQVTDKNYTGTANGLLTINKAAATVTINAPTATYDGNAHLATAITTPAGLSVNVTYTLNGNAVTTPTAAATYAVTATVNDPNYTGSNTGTLTINKAVATVTINAPTATYDGNAHLATATTAPSGLSVTVAYTLNGNPVTTPTAAGSYAVSATVNDSNYTGSNTGTLVISGATPSITFSIGNHTFGDAPFPVSASSNSSGAITYSIVPGGTGSANVTGSGTVTITGAGTLTVRASQAAAGNYAAATKDATFAVAKANPILAWAMPNAVVSGTALSAAQLNATAKGVDGAILSGSFTYSPAGGTVLSTPGSVTLSAQFAPTDTNNYNTGLTVATSITVVAATSTVTISSSLNPAPQGVGVPLGVVVSTGGAVPTGTVTVSEGTTVLTTLTLGASGSASYTATNLSVGSHTLTFAYSGSATVTPSSNTLTETIQPYVITTTGGNNQGVTLTANSGDAANLSLSVVSGALSAGTVGFQCTGLPANAVCVFNPTTLTLVAGGAPQNLTVTITTQTTASLTVPKFFGSPVDEVRLATIFSLPALLLAGVGSRSRRLRLPALTLLCLVALAGMGTLTGCGGSSDSTSSPSKTPTTQKVAAGTYNINVVATSGTTSVSLPVTFTVR